MAQPTLAAPSGPKQAHARMAHTKPIKPVRTTLPSHSEEVRAIPMSVIQLDSAYQRDLNATKVQAMVRNWDARLVGVLVLSARGDKLWCVDGQHRLAAMRERDEQTVPAIVLTGLNQREEADLFVRYNRSRAALNEWDLFRAEIIAGNEDVWDIVRTFNQHGLTLTRAATSPTNIQALGSVRRLYRLGGMTLLAKVLTTIKGLWSHERLGWGAATMYGLGLFFYAFENHERYDPARTQRVLEANTPLTFLRKAQEVAFSITGNRGGGTLMTEAIRVIYNEGLSRPKQLGSIKFKKVQGVSGEYRTGRS